MADVFTRGKRSEVMRAVRGAQTGPENRVLAIVVRLRFRPIRNDATLPGRPDLVFPRRKKIILVHGCFWHRHHCQNGRSTPSSNVDFWTGKFKRNRRRDAKVRRLLRLAGWSVMTVWECQTRNPGLARLE